MLPPFVDSTQYFQQLIDSMEKLEKELRVIQTTAHPLPKYAYFTFCLCIYSLNAACCWRMGMKEKAHEWAKRYLALIQLPLPRLALGANEILC